VAYQIEVTKDAARALNDLDKPIRRRVQARIDRLADEPRPPEVVAMKSMPGCLRVKVGPYRIIYQVHDHRLTVLVIQIGHRREIYR
jgi:mRNA interferase RelE/StbE